MIGVLALGASVRGWLLARPLAALDGRSLPDDAYIALEIAHNIGSGHGPRFAEYLTNGFQPLFVWLAAIPFLWTTPGTLDPSQLDWMVKFALALCCAFDLGSLWLLAAAVRRGTGSHLAGVFAGLLWALQPAVLRVAVNGLETAIAIFFLLCVWNLMLNQSFAASKPSRLFRVGLVVGVGAMARVDLLLVGLFFAVASIRALRAADKPAPEWPQWFATNAALAAGTLAGYAPWMAYSYHHTQAIFPGSGRAVRWIALTHANHVLDRAFYSKMMLDGLAAIDGNLPILGKAAALIVVAAIARTLWRRTGSAGPLSTTPASQSGVSWLALPIAFGASLYLAYTLYVFAPWFFPRYLAPLHVPAIAIVTAGVAQLARAAGRRRHLVWLTAALVATLSATSQSDFRELLFDPPDEHAGYRNLGLWARTTFSTDTVIGAPQTGALAYYSAGHRVVNLDGVVNDRAYQAIASGDAMAYVRQEEVDYVVAWRRGYEYLKRNSTGFRESDLQLVGYLDQFRSWGIQWQVYRVGYPDGREPPALSGRR